MHSIFGFCTAELLSFFQLWLKLTVNVFGQLYNRFIFRLWVGYIWWLKIMVEDANCDTSQCITDRYIKEYYSITVELPMTWICPEEDVCKSNHFIILIILNLFWQSHLFSWLYVCELQTHEKRSLNEFESHRKFNFLTINLLIIRKNGINSIKYYHGIIIL